jgi:hypothetical protein
MLLFKAPTPADRDTLNTYLRTNTFRNCDFSFANLYAWAHLYQTTFAIPGDGFLYIRFHKAGAGAGYLFPLGAGDFRAAIQTLSADAAERGDAFRLYSITPDMLAQIQAAFPGRFRYEPCRDAADYLYNTQDLIHLAGKKFQPKRNHIHRFRRTYNWEYLPLTPDLIPDCLRLYQRWCAEARAAGNTQPLEEEYIATQRAFAHYEALGLCGGVLRIDGEVLAYTYGQPLTADTFGVHAEKCIHSLDGGFATINQAFVTHAAASYAYINREEDLGLPTLRQAKLSYHPTLLLEKGIIQEV